MYDVLRSALWAKIHRPPVGAQPSMASEPPSSFDIAAGISSPRPYDRCVPAPSPCVAHTQLVRYPGHGLHCTLRGHKVSCRAAPTSISLCVAARWQVVLGPACMRHVRCLLRLPVPQLAFSQRNVTCLQQSQILSCQNKCRAAPPSIFKDPADSKSRMGRHARGKSDNPPDYFPDGATSDGWAREAPPAGMPRIVVSCLLWPQLEC